jgi:hypothetical protein
MAHEVFISYKRTDQVLCDEVYRLIQSIGYIAYRDVDDLAAGRPWRDQLLDALAQPDLKPYVIILCTKAVVAEPKGVMEEIILAREQKLTIIPVEFDSGTTKFLLKEAGYSEPEKIHYINAVDQSGLYVVNDRLEDALRRALTIRIRKWLEERRVFAKDWAERLTPKISFWDMTWRDYFLLDGPHRLSGSVALTARGGSGKSFLIAHCVRYLLNDPEVYPVLVDEEMLHHAASELPRLLGARSAAALPQKVESLAEQLSRDHLGWKPMHVVFVVDGLDQMVIPGDVQQKQLVDGLNLLVNSAPVLIGCRKEVWDPWYAGRVSVREAPVAELDEPRVRELLRSNTKLNPDSFNALLQVPFFLDIALRKASVWDSLPRKETDFLQQIWSDAVTEGSPGQHVLPGDTGRAWLMENVAAYQLEQLAYDVPLVELHKRLGYMPGYETGLRALKASGLLVEQPARVSGAGSTVRLRHDLLDNYSMVRALLSAPEKLERSRDLCRRCDKDCGWSVLATLVQAAHDSGYEELKRELFAEFLFLLDHKKFGNEEMTRAWSVTHVLRTCFHSLFDLIIETLAGEPVPSLNEKNPTHTELRPSQLGPSPRLTQEAASTLASAFMALHIGTVEEAEVAVPVLASGLIKWPLKARFLDALGKYRTADALNVIVSFARRQLRERDDIGSLPYVAANLQHFQDPAARELLREMIVDTTLDSSVRRMAAEGLNHLLPGQVLVPPRDENEIVRKLEVREPDGVRYSDWHIVQDYADYVRGQVARGVRFGPRVLEALIRALAHDQNFVRCSVAEALALFDEPMARDALLNEVLELALPAEVRSACLKALGLQLRRLADPRARQACRYLLLRAAGAARQSGNILVEQRLIDLALNPEFRTPEDWLLSTRAVEVLPPANAQWSSRCSVTAEEVEPAVLRDLAEIESENVGPNREPKYRFSDLKSIGGVLNISLAPTTWQLGKNFHNAVRKHPDRFLRDAGRWLVPLPLGEARLPGLAVVHVILLTVDNRLLLAQRSAKLAYAPLHWSVSFEEQVTEPDVRDGSRVFHRAARRGMVEEFGIDVDPSRIHLISAFLEMDNLNLAAVVLIDAKQTLEQIRQSWSGEPRPSHAWEAEALDGTDADPVALDALAGGAEFRLEPLHPTARVRCAMLARWLRWRGRSDG